MHTRILAHRGFSAAAPENTLAAFQAAIDCGADGVEFDVQRTRDGVLVVIHDETLHRTTSGSGAVAQTDWAALQRLDAGAWFGEAFAGEGVPTLDAVFALLRETALLLNVELKTDRKPYPGLEGQVVEAIVRHGLEQRVIVSSFNQASLAALQACTPRLPSGALFRMRDVDWLPLLDQGHASLHPPGARCTAELVAACHARGQQVIPWTVDDPALAETLLTLGVDAIITNRPDELLALRARVQGPETG